MHQCEKSSSPPKEGLAVLDFPVLVMRQIYVCVDEENSLAEMLFYCDPDDMGTKACYKQAAGANTRALDIHVGVLVIKCPAVRG